MKINFIRKATPSELIPQDEFVIEKIVVIDKNLFECFINDPLNDYDFIKKNLEHMYCDHDEVFHCIFVTCMIIWFDTTVSNLFLLFLRKRICI